MKKFLGKPAVAGSMHQEQSYERKKREFHCKMVHDLSYLGKVHREEGRNIKLAKKTGTQSRPVNAKKTAWLHKVTCQIYILEEQHWHQFWKWKKEKCVFHLDATTEMSAAEAGNRRRWQAGKGDKQTSKRLAQWSGLRGRVRFGTTPGSQHGLLRGSRVDTGSLQQAAVHEEGYLDADRLHESKDCGQQGTGGGRSALVTRTAPSTCTWTLWR